MERKSISPNGKLKQKQNNSNNKKISIMEVRHSVLHWDTKKVFPQLAHRSW